MSNRQISAIFGFFASSTNQYFRDSGIRDFPNDRTAPLPNESRPKTIPPNELPNPNFSGFVRDSFGIPELEKFGEPLITNHAARPRAHQHKEQVVSTARIKTLFPIRVLATTLATTHSINQLLLLTPLQKHCVQWHHHHCCCFSLNQINNVVPDFEKVPDMGRFGISADRFRPFFET